MECVQMQMTQGQFNEAEYKLYARPSTWKQAVAEHCAVTL